MPPWASWWRGRETIAGFAKTAHEACPETRFGSDSRQRAAGRRLLLPGRGNRPLRGRGDRRNHPRGAADQGHHRVYPPRALSALRPARRVRALARWLRPLTRVARRMCSMIEATYGSPHSSGSRSAPRRLLARDEPITQLVAGVPISDLDASTDWYTRFFGRPPDTSRRGRGPLGDRRTRHASSSSRTRRGRARAGSPSPSLGSTRSSSASLPSASSTNRSRPTRTASAT